MPDGLLYTWIQACLKSPETGKLLMTYNENML